MAHHAEAARGREAERPGEIPTRGWKDILLRVKDEMTADNLSMVAAGVAFYILLAIFPALAALISIWGLFADPATVQQQIDSLGTMLPQQALAILDEQMTRVAGSASNALSVGIIIGILAALWAAAKGMKALIEALNIVYDETESRGFIKLNAIALLLTLGLILFIIVTIGAVVVLPALLGNLGLGSTMGDLLSLARWPLLAVMMMLTLAILYRFAPSRDTPRWQWVSWGAVGATVLWIIGSILFSWYVSNFGSYNETYGSVGAVIILMMWFWLSAYIVLIGAEVNAEMEHQTARDTTTGSRQPRGSRGAHVADTVGESR
jgi:membrane protein